MKRLRIKVKEAPLLNQFSLPTIMTYIQGLMYWLSDPALTVEVIIDVQDSRSDALRSFLDRYGIPYSIIDKLHHPEK